MERRNFITILLGAAAWPFAVRGQTKPVVGFLNSTNPVDFGALLDAFHKGLGEAGFVEGTNVTIEYRWAEGRYDSLPDLAKELVRLKVAVIAATGGTVAARAAIGATAKIPILFLSAYDPTQVGLADTFNHPAGNATGVTVYTTLVAAKRLEALRELLPKASLIAVLVNPNTLTVSSDAKIDRELSDLEAAARAFDLRLLILRAGSEPELESAFVTAVQQGADGLIITADPFFTSKSKQLVALARRYALPTTYPWRAYTIAGGLMSYGPSLNWAYEEIGDYTGRILKGAKPSELPIQAPTTFDFVINLNTARALGLSIPRLVLDRANEVIQ